MHGITKRFPGVVANDGVDFEAAVGEVHALLGENGAGKSTLSNILTGLYRPDEGEILLYGEPVALRTRRATRSTPGSGWCTSTSGSSSRSPSPRTSSLGEHRAGGRGRSAIDPRRSSGASRELGERYGLEVDPRARIWQLSVGEQQRVEILKALYRDARILILDEPTAVLTPQEAETLFATLRADGGRRAHGHLHLAQAERGDGGLRPRHGAARRQVDRDGLDRRGDAALARRADGRPRARRAARASHGPPRPDRVLELEDVWVVGNRGTDGGARRVARRSAPARSSRSPASPATGSASSGRRSRGCARPRGARSRSTARRLRAATLAPRSTPASRSSPRTG